MTTCTCVPVVSFDLRDVLAKVLMAVREKDTIRLWRISSVFKYMVVDETLGSIALLYLKEWNERGLMGYS